MAVESSASDFFVGFYMQALQLIVTTSELDMVTFSIETRRNFEYIGNVTRDSSTVVSLPRNFQVLDNNDNSKGIWISAGDKQIAVYGLSYNIGSSDAFLALPCSRQNVGEYVYYGVSYGASQLLFVGCEDSTTIKIGSQEIPLNKMETYIHKSESDLTGTRVTSNKPISFFSGHPCANIPINREYCDQLNEQIPNTATWGTHFLSASLSSRSSGDIYRVVASQPSTNVTFTCSTLSQPSTYTLPSNGSWKEFTTSDYRDSFCVIESDNPVLVVQFGLGHENRNGDPFMMIVPALEQYSNNYVFNLSSKYSNFITIFVADEDYQPDMIYVDNTSQEGANWTTVCSADNATCGYVAYASLDAGHHRLYHMEISAKIGVSVYGFGEVISYGYPGGLRLVPNQGII